MDIRKHTVMLIEDSEADMDALVECLGDTYKVIVATDGETAIQEVKTRLPDIILLDIMMPVIDGFAVCSRIKQNRATKEIPIIFVTGLTDPIDEAKGLALGAVDYITKPFSFSVIRARVKTHLELVSARKELEAKNKALEENIQLREQVELITRHDLRNPLNVILGTAELLETFPSRDKTDMERLVKNLTKAGYTMLDMINRTQNLYKMEKGIYTLQTEKINIIPLLEHILSGSSPQISSKDIHVDISINGHPRDFDEPFIIWCDELLFYSMLSNLISNAVEASPVGGAIQIRFTKNEWIAIEIQNQGTVHPQIRDCFFDKFSSYGKPNAIGIGTYSVWLSTQLHEGVIDFVTSENENKTTISIHLPKKRGDLAYNPESRILLHC